MYMRSYSAECVVQENCSLPPIRTNAYACLHLYLCMYVYFWLYICFGIFSWIHGTRALFFPPIQKHSTTSTLLQKKIIVCNNIHTIYFVCVLFCKHIFCVGATANTKNKNCTHTHTHTHTQTHCQHSRSHPNSPTHFQTCMRTFFVLSTFDQCMALAKMEIYLYTCVRVCVCERERERKCIHTSTT